MNPIENNIQIRQPSNTPKILYKYRFFDNKKNQRRIVTNSELWFTSAKKFSDPLDSNIFFDFEDKPQGIMMKWLINAVRIYEPNIPPEIVEERARQRYQRIQSDRNYWSRISKEILDNNHSKFGICSLSAVKDEILMWSNYVKNHEGFCLGLDTKSLKKYQLDIVKSQKVLIELHEINYTDEMPKINFFNSMLSDQMSNFYNILFLMNTKSNNWKYEKEYRLIYWDNVDVALKIDRSILKELILEYNITKKNKEEILAEIEDQNLEINIYQSVKNQTESKLDFIRIK